MDGAGSPPRSGLRGPDRTRSRPGGDRSGSGFPLVVANGLAERVAFVTMLDRCDSAAESRRATDDRRASTSFCANLLEDASCCRGASPAIAAQLGAGRQARCWLGPFGRRHRALKCSSAVALGRARRGSAAHSGPTRRAIRIALADASSARRHRRRSVASDASASCDEPILETAPRGWRRDRRRGRQPVARRSRPGIPHQPIGLAVALRDRVSTRGFDAREGSIRLLEQRPGSAWPARPPRCRRRLAPSRSSKRHR